MVLLRAALMTRSGADNGSDRPRRAELKFQDRKLDGALDPKTAGLLVIDSTGDGSADLLGLVAQWDQPVPQGQGTGRLTPAPPGHPGVISVAAGDFDNDGLTDLCVLTETGASL